MLVPRVAGRMAPAALQRHISVVAGNRILTRNALELHPLWLRERCAGPSSVHWETLQPLRQPHELPLDLAIINARVRAGGGGGPQQVSVTFSDGHTSTFDGDALEEEAADFFSHGIQQKDIGLPRIQLWDARSGAMVPRISYEDLESGTAKTMLELTTKLLKQGHVVIERVPCSDKEMLNVAKMISGFHGGSSVRPTNWGETFNVRSMPDGELKDLAYFSEALFPHVDNPYRDPNPGFQLLHALENECSTGLSLVVDGFAVAERLRQETPEYFDLLSSVAARWENDGGDRTTALIHFAPYIHIDRVSGKVMQIRYSPKSGGYFPALGDSQQMAKLYAARHRFAQLLDAEEYAVYFRLNKGDLWIFSNLRLLHGRSAFDPNEGNRFFQGAYFDMDAVTGAFFRAKYRIQIENKLASQEAF